jgi:hypothetical protein
MSLGTGSIERFRFQHNQALPAWYGWGLHVGFNACALLTTTVGAALLIPKFNLAEILMLAFGFVAFAVLEYFIHRFVLHGPHRSRLSFEHSVQHHTYFTHLFMQAGEPIDLNRVLLFPADLVSAVAVNMGVALAVGAAAGFHRACLAFIAGNLYITAYEIAHAICHAPYVPRILQKMVAHHKAHHDPQNMRAANFAIVFPVLDTLFKTRVRP